MNVRLLTITLAVVGGASLAGKSVRAQHFDVFVGRPTVGTQTAYGGIDVDTADITLGVRVFESEMGEDPFDGNYISADPGFNSPEDDSALPPGAASLLVGDEIYVTALPLTVNAVTDTLFYWNALGSVTFAPAVGATFTIDTGNMTGRIGTAGVGGGFDDHPFFVLDDSDGMASTFPMPGIYLASFRAQVADLDPSDPLYLVMGTDGLITPEFLGIDQAEFDLLTDDDLDEHLEGIIEIGVEWVQGNLMIPEPTCLAMLGIACCAFVVNMRLIL